ncbi:hypothetical protein AB0I81_56550 [Nonomuraea sp. NPDC050404]|uniref:hypothetical protein n=1 Tax=Nonomuraea sp. NPDC050404 TaxID=3155783 RepID=UPI0033EA4F14
MRTSVRRIAVTTLIAAAFGMAAPAVAAHAVIDPSKASVVESLQKVDPILMANCTTGSAGNPVGAVAVPPEIPLVGCLTL